MDSIPFSVRIKITAGLISFAILCVLLSLFFAGKAGGKTTHVDASSALLVDIATIIPTPTPTQQPTQTPFAYDYVNIFPPDEGAKIDPPHPDNIAIATQQAAVLPTLSPTATLIPFLHYYQKTATAEPPAQKTVIALTKTPEPGLVAGITCEIMVGGVMRPVDCKEWNLDQFAYLGGKFKNSATSSEAGSASWESIPPVSGAEHEELIRASWYSPALGGTNCGSFVGGICVSNMASGLYWLPWMGKALACPMSWPFYTRVIFPNGAARVCLDHGGAIRYVDGITWIDMLDTGPTYPFGSLVRVKVIFP